MSEFTERLRRYEEVIQRLAAALRTVRLYSLTHPRVAANVNALLEAIRHLQALQTTVLIGFVSGEIIADDTPLPKASAGRGELIQRLMAIGIHRISIEQGITAEELTTFVEAVSNASASKDPTGQPEDAEEESEDFIVLPHLRAGRILIDPTSGEWGSGSAATARQHYRKSVSSAKTVWESAQTEGMPALPAARDAVENLAEAVTTNRTAIVGLTAMQKYDDYTFTHMVNVSILTMGQARGLGIDGRRLRELGLAALMHDIGKVRVPTEVLNKPDKLTDQEFALLKRHTTDGAQILRRTPEMPPLAPVVAFEHHLRLDGSGYPDSVTRTSLNLATMLCSIADVYDAMRSQRKYQETFASDRVISVMKRNDGRQFDQNLVRRFIQLIGIYPPGSLVRLSSGEIAVVVRVHAPDPVRPAVRVLFSADGEKLETPEDRNLWESTNGSDTLSVAAPVKPEDYQIDPLRFL